MKTQYFTSLLLFATVPFVLGAAPADDRKIEKAAKSSYNYRTVLDNQVEVKVKDGHVTLTGKLRDDDARELAVETVKNLPGVKEVQNDIEVESVEATGSDEWIAFKVRGNLLVKAKVSVARTEVEVADGVVTLTGTAETEAQKALTEVYVKEVEGVKSVRNNIVIQPATADRIANNVGSTTGDTNSRGGSTGSSGTSEAMADRNSDDAIDDASITTQVKIALRRNKTTKGLTTEVTTNEGVVEIKGKAKSDAEKTLVSKVAQATRGVRSVNNDMTIAQR